MPACAYVLAPLGCEVQVQLDKMMNLVKSFPQTSQRKAVFALSELLSAIRSLDRKSQAATQLVADDLRPIVEQAREQAREINNLFYAAGCMVCSEPVRSVAVSDFENPNMARYEEFEPRLLQRPQRDAREEKAALALGFRPD